MSDAVTEYLDIAIKPTLGLDEGIVEFTLDAQFGQQKDGKTKIATRRAQSDFTIFFGTSVVFMQRSALAPGKVSLLFITPKTE